MNLNALSFSPFNKQAYQESRKNIDRQLSHNSRELNPDAADLQRKKRKEGFGEGGGKHRQSRTENGRQVLGPQIDKWPHRNENTKLFRFSKEVKASKYIRESHQLKSRIVLVVIEWDYVGAKVLSKETVEESSTCKEWEWAGMIRDIFSNPYS